MMSSRAVNYEYPSSADTDAIAALCKAAGDPLRMQILKVLQQNAYGVLELCAVFDIRQPAMSHHLKILKQAGLVSARREGTSVFYQRAGFPAQSLPASLFQALDQTPLPTVALNKVDEIYAERAHQSASFFHNNADVLDHQSELICPSEAVSYTHLTLPTICSV